MSKLFEMTESISITKEFSFEYAHMLNMDYESGCRNVHGHSGRIFLTLYANKLDRNGMVIDFGHLVPIKEFIDTNLDHALILGGSERDKNLREALKPFNFKTTILDFEPTSENMATWLANQFYTILTTNVGLVLSGVKVVFYETAKNSATYEMMITEMRNNGT